MAAVRGNSWFFRTGLGTHHLDDHDQVFCIVFGSPGDIPVTGDWDDGTGTFAVARAGFHDAFFVTNFFDRGTAEYPMTYGNNGDRPVSWQSASAVFADLQGHSPRKIRKDESRSECRRWVRYDKQRPARYRPEAAFGDARPSVDP